MNKRVICARASALFATAESAAPLPSGFAVIPDNGIENDRMLCGQAMPILMGTIAAGFAKR